jgi:hypothetical protein
MINATPGRMEIVIKFDSVPDAVQIRDGYRVELDCDGIRVIATVRPRSWGRLEKAAAEYPCWVAALTGTMGVAVGKGRGFLLESPSLQIFEKKVKSTEPPPAPPAPETPETV